MEPEPLAEGLGGPRLVKLPGSSLVLSALVRCYFLQDVTIPLTLSKCLKFSLVTLFLSWNQALVTEEVFMQDI